MNFAELHKQKQQLSYAEALVKLRPTNEGMRELSSFKKEVKQSKMKRIAVAN